MKTRFDLENAIMAVKSTEDDLKAFLEAYVDRPVRMTEDDVWNYVSGIQHVLELRNCVLWDTFTQVFKLDEYSPYSAHFADIQEDV